MLSEREGRLYALPDLFFPGLARRGKASMSKAYLAVLEKEKRMCGQMESHNVRNDETGIGSWCSAQVVSSPKSKNAVVAM